MIIEFGKDLQMSNDWTCVAIVCILISPVVLFIGDKLVKPEMNKNAKIIVILLEPFDVVYT